jgi:hypothetical protein
MRANPFLHYYLGSSSAYSANYRAHTEGMTKEDVAEYYSKWADSGKYEEVIHVFI